MVTQAVFDADPYVRREIVTPELDWLGDEICQRTGQPRTAFGTKGDRHHLRGAHRSQEFILRSPLCTSRTYTVQSGLTAEQERYIAGADFTPGDWGTAANRALMVEQTRRLVAALTAGRLAGVREVIGTLDGRTVVGTRPDGSTFASDSSHLEHWHATIDRRRLRDRALMERILAVALGEDDDMDLDQIATINSTAGRAYALFADKDQATWYDPRKKTTVREPNAAKQRRLVLEANVAALAGRDWVDEEQIVRGVLDGLGHRPVQEAADALRAVYEGRPDELAQLVALLGGTGTGSSE